MTGTILNVAGIVLGGVAGLLWRKQLPPRTQFAAKGLLGVFTVYVGLKLTWTSLGPGFFLMLKGLFIVILAMTLGRLTGRLLHLQKAMNRAGHYAKQKMAQPIPANSRPFSEGFTICTILFCFAPLALLGALQDGLSGYWQPLGLKALIDGLAAMAIVGTFGAGVIFAAIPVAAYQGTLSLGAQSISKWLQDYSLLDSVNATAGLLIFCVALLILEIRKVEVADYLPSLAFAPLITWLWK